MNKVILAGTLAYNPELKTTQGGISFCNFVVACNQRVKNAEGNRGADFIQCVAWRNRAEFIAKWFSKGSRIAVEGHISVNKYNAQDGTKRTSWSVVVENVEFTERSMNSLANNVERIDSVDEQDIDSDESIYDDDIIPF